MQVYFLSILLLVLPLQGRETGKSETERQVEELRAKAHSGCHRGSFYDIISSAWTPTLLFGSSLAYEGIKSYRNSSSSLPTFSMLKDTIKEAPRFFMFSSAILLGCMVYNYYEPMFKNLYARYCDAKKNP